MTTAPKTTPAEVTPQVPNDSWVWPMPVYQTWPPSKSEHHEIGWSSLLPSLPSSSL